MHDTDTVDQSNIDEGSDIPPPNTQDNTSSSGITSKDTSAPSDSHSATMSMKEAPHRDSKAQKVPKIPITVTNPLRVDVRWAPKEFKLLKSSSALMYARLAPILSGFNTTRSWVVEWQTDQMAKTHTIEPTHLTKFLSIRKVTSAKQQCFYLSFRVNATGSQFIQVLKSKAMQALKKGESISFDTSHIPHTQGEAINIGDILLKDATITHRSNYLKYLRADVLPPETPAFDLKIRYKDPTGNRIPILTVRCGKSVSTQVAQLLSMHLNGEGTNPEIFISRLALGANRSTRGDHEKIYQVHHDFMADIVYLPFHVTKQIDEALVEYTDTGEQLQRTPRQWAKSLVSADGTSLEIDIENGNPENEVSLIVPSASLERAKSELQQYYQRQNPRLLNAKRFYTDSVLADPDIPLTIFTKNIDTILAKKIRKSLPSQVNASVLSPASSLTGQTAKTATTSKTTSIAWQVPLQRSVSDACNVNAPNHPQQPRLSKREMEQQQRISSLEAQLASMSAGNSRTSGEKSQLSGNSPNSLATAHARLDGIEHTVLNIQTLLEKMVKKQDPPLSAEASTDPSWPKLPCKQLFSDEPHSGNQLAILHSASTSSPAKQKAAKRRKATTSISTDLIPQYNSTMESGGSDSC